jgi:hypothetical protein
MPYQLHIRFVSPAYVLVVAIFFLAMGIGLHATAALAPDDAMVIVSETQNDGDSLDVPTLVDGLTEEERAAYIDDFFIRKGNLPLAGYGMHFVRSADAAGIDWRLLPSIGFIESTGGKFACKTVSYAAFGWGSCRIAFSSYEESIERISQHLGGHIEATAHYYKGKDTLNILRTYNPPSIAPDYAQKVMRTMDNIFAVSV